MKVRSSRRVVAAAAATALLLAACAGSEESPSADSSATDTGPTSGTANDGDQADLDGSTLSIIYPYSGDDEQLFLDMVNEWAEPNGVEIQGEATGGQPLVDIRVQSGSPPDLAVFPNPALMYGFWDRGEMRSIEDLVDRGALEDSLIPGVIDIGEGTDGTLIGLPFRLSVKSLVWYPRDAFEQGGYEVPETWDDMMDLSQQIRDDGTAPWCIGIESGGATGWPATDWMEDIMLRTAGPEVYDQWVNHEIPFNDPVVVAAGERFADLAFEEGFVRGGRQSMVTTSFGDSPGGMFQDPPACLLHRQANFITGFFPDDVQGNLSEEVGVFPFPNIDPEYQDVVLGGGNFLAIFTDNPAAEALLQHLANPESGSTWAAAGGFLSPHADFDQSLYPDETTRDLGEQLVNAEDFRFDASDLMPEAIGSGAFWTGMTSWVNGDDDLETVLSNIEVRWESLDEG